MSSELFLVALAVGAGLLAVWIHARFPTVAPERVGKTMLHAGAAFLLLKLTPGFGDSPVTLFAGVLLFVLPTLVYALLCTIWMLKIFQTAVGMSR